MGLCSDFSHLVRITKVSLADYGKPDEFLCVRNLSVAEVKEINQSETTTLELLVKVLCDEQGKQLYTEAAQLDTLPIPLVEVLAEAALETSKKK